MAVMKIPRLLCLLIGLLAIFAQAEGLQPNRQVILVIRPDGPKFEETLKGLRQELGAGFQVMDKVHDPKSTASALIKDLRTYRPLAVVLMDNGPISLYGAAQREWTDSIAMPPSICLMAVRVDRAMEGLQRSMGIFYEVPAVITMMNLRNIMKAPLRRVGVVHRHSMDGFIRRQAELCESENIELVQYQISDSTRDVVGAVRAGLHHLTRRENVDAIWIPNDNFYLTPEIIERAWLPGLERYRKPVVVGVENLVSPVIKFGTFAVLPDHYGLGAQAAGLILEGQDDAWDFEAGTVHHSLAVHKILNIDLTLRYMRINKDRLNEIDILVER